MTDITIETDTNKRGRTKRMCRMTPTYETEAGSFDGWVSGLGGGPLNGRGSGVGFRGNGHFLLDTSVRPSNVKIPTNVK